MTELQFLHVGCGSKRKESTTKVFAQDVWKEVTLDIDTDCQPDIIGTMTDLSVIEDNSFDAVYSSHNIEHLYIHEALQALSEFRRVLKDTGYLMIVCPDLISTCKALIKNGPFEPLYYLRDSKTKEINKNLWVSPIDVLYGYRPAIENGNDYMAHKSGYTEKSLTQMVLKSGFLNVVSTSRERYYDINLMGFKKALTDEEIAKKLLLNHLEDISS